MRDAYGIYVNPGSTDLSINNNKFVMPAHKFTSSWIGVFVLGDAGDNLTSKVSVAGGTVDFSGGTGSGPNVFVRFQGELAGDAYGIKDVTVKDAVVQGDEFSKQSSFGVSTQGVDGFTFRGNTFEGIGNALVGGGIPTQNLKTRGIVSGGNSVAGATSGYALESGALEGGILFEEPDKDANFLDHLLASVVGEDGKLTVYLSVDDAINSIPDSKPSTIKLLKTSSSQIVIPENKDITVDLNGKNAAGVNTSAFKVDGKLTITDSSAGLWDPCIRISPPIVSLKLGQRARFPLRLVSFRSR